MHPSQVLAQAPEERVPDPSLGRLRAIFDLCQKLGFNPDALVADALGIGLGLSDEGFKPLLQIGRRDLVETVVDFASIDQFVAFLPAMVNVSRCAQVFLTQSFVRPVG